jgi:uncharacterized membrane protein YdjX (TVP38/TMEM64 family)
MIEIFGTFANFMFGSFWGFIGSLIIIFISASVAEFVIDRVFTFLEILIRGHPVTNNYITQGEKSSEEEKKDE